ncbi:MAG: hypothetical protein HKO66_16670, partial [Saprospiraceae bacterium]|nr:hypothetical protein [Saprospiraceae bacterium]
MSKEKLSEDILKNRILNEALDFDPKAWELMEKKLDDNRLLLGFLPKKMGFFFLSGLLLITLSLIFFNSDILKPHKNKEFSESEISSINNRESNKDINHETHLSEDKKDNENQKLQNELESNEVTKAKELESESESLNHNKTSSDIKSTSINTSSNENDIYSRSQSDNSPKVFNRLNLSEQGSTNISKGNSNESNINELESINQTDNSSSINNTSQSYNFQQSNSISSNGQQNNISNSEEKSLSEQLSENEIFESKLISLSFIDGLSLKPLDFERNKIDISLPFTEIEPVTLPLNRFFFEVN